MVRRITKKQRANKIQEENRQKENKFSSVLKEIGSSASEAIKYGFSVGEQMKYRSENGYRTIDYTAMNERCKLDILSDLIDNLSIDEFCGFNNKNEKYLKRLMALNVSEHDITMRALGTDASYNGDGSKITNNAYSPSYVMDINYTDNFARYVDTAEKDGQLSTRQRIENNTGNYSNHGNLYGEVSNLFPDDNDSLTDSDMKWKVGDRDSILTKTKDLFNRAKINTLISRFHGDGGINGGAENVSNTGDAKTSRWGKSHGKNLLLKSVEDKGDNGYLINGYNNPYCRVWTHHYQYDQLYKRIRPFYTLNKDGNFEGVRELKDFHKWSSFSHSSNGNVTNNKKGNSKWGWKSGDNDTIWDKSVLNDNGMLNITPKYQGGGGFNIHTKQCMFSIENLAWKGYDPYSFEQALSWEQRGPNGGRIMWFPPYGIEFNETTNVNWSSNTFIGRGEDVYTYTNTQRTGTLSFMMLVDHPSLIDYASWHGGDGLKDTDLLRFFAGCDSGDSEDEDSILSHVKPTPLTDEYLQNVDEELLQVDAVVREPEQEKTVETMTLDFYVFYPNNYSGYYDVYGEKVEAVAYLIAGVGAQKRLGTGDNINETDDIDLTVDMLSDNNNWGYGYEIKDKGGISKKQDEETNFIFGTKPIWQYQKSDKYVFNGNKWFYRIDGKYEKPQKSEYYINTYDQTLLKGNNYSDSNSYGLNSDADEVRNVFKVNKDEENKSVLYSFCEVIAALESEKNESVTNNIVKNTTIDKERVEKVKKIFYGEETDNGNRKEGKYKIIDVSIIGYSNSHDKNKNKSVNSSAQNVSQDRNLRLATNRGVMISNWLKNRYKDLFGREDIKWNSRVMPSMMVNASDKEDVNGKTAKKWRSAKVSIIFEREVTTTLAESDSEDSVEYIGYTKTKDENQKDCYKNDSDGSIWYISDDKRHFTRKINKLGSIVTRSGASIPNMANLNMDSWKEISFEEYQKIYQYMADSVFVKKNKSGQSKYYVKLTEFNKRLNIKTPKGTNEYNNLRYDQEYHFFKQLQNSDPMIFDSLMKKIQYFDPAFHSMTPEGFNARLTFLQQCTRQGNTIGASDKLAKSANNLAFGRAPYCVLRLGDFYNQLIVIDNISVNYDPLCWDLNTEGIGVQPLLAYVSLSFKFIGGGDIAGPVRRLQNAMTFNYYANSRLYDNRSDRPSYKENYVTGVSELETDKSYAYTTEMKKEIK